MLTLYQKSFTSFLFKLLQIAHLKLREILLFYIKFHKTSKFVIQYIFIRTNLNEYLMMNIHILEMSMDKQKNHFEH